MHRLLACLLVLLVASAARAQAVGSGDGTIALQGGFHVIPQSAFLSTQQQAGEEPLHKYLQPGGFASLGYQLDDELHASVDFGYSLDNYGLKKSGDLQVRAFTIMLAIDTVIYKAKNFTFYGGGGLGYSLNTINRQGRDAENNSTAGMAKVGVRVGVVPRIALVVEDRYIVSSTALPELNSNINIGGNYVTVGLLFHFFEEDEKSHPAGPK